MIFAGAETSLERIGGEHGRQSQEGRFSRNCKEPKKVDRREFLRALGLGLGAIGLGLAARQPAHGLHTASETLSTRAEIQAFVRDLIKNPHVATRFLENPEEVATMYGIRLSDQDLANIHGGLMRLAAGWGGTTYA